MNIRTATLEPSTSPTPFPRPVSARAASAAATELVHVLHSWLADISPLTSSGFAEPGPSKVIRGARKR